MKVLQINSVCGLGSTGRIVVDINQTLEQNGHEGYILYGRGKAPADINAHKIGTKFEFIKHVTLTRLFDAHGLGSIKDTKKLIKKIEDFQPDIIHLHNIHGYYLNIQLLFNFLRKQTIPIFWTFHDAWAFSGHSAYIDFNEQGELPQKNDSFQERFEYPKSVLLDRSEKNYLMKLNLFSGLEKLTIFTPSDWLNNLARNSFFKNNEIKTIHNGIDISKFKPVKTEAVKKKYNLIGKKIILGVANIWEPRKGLNYFNELVEKLSDDYQIIIIGDTRKYHLKSKIIHIPQTRNVDELCEFYSVADIFFNPTLQDNFPTTNIEALACGTPVITFDSGGSKEMLNPDVGRVIGEKNITNVIEAINSIEKSSEISFRCVNQARLFDKDIAYEKYLNEYLKKVKV